MRIARTLLALVVLATGALIGITAPAGAADDVFRYDCLTGDAYVTGYTGTGTDVTVPTTLGSGGASCEVHTIMSGAFAGKGLTSVTFLNGPTVEAGAFANNSLRTVTFAGEGAEAQVAVGAFAGQQLAGVPVIGWLDERDHLRSDLTGNLSGTFTAATEERHTVTFDPLNGTEPVFEQQVFDGDPAELPETPTAPPTEADRVDLLGWFTTGGDRWDFAAPITGPLVLEARWEHVYDDHTVTFDPDNGRAATILTARHGDVLLERPPPASPPLGDAADVIFLGWFDVATDALWVFGDPSGDTGTVLTGDVTLRARWQFVDTETHLVTLQPHNGFAARTLGVADGVTLAAPAAPVPAPVPEPGSDIERYAFAGWALTADGTDAFDFTTPVTGPLTLHATWRPVLVSHAVTLVLANGYGSADLSVAHGDPVPFPTLAPPVPPGGYFPGWRPPAFEGWADESGAHWATDTPVTGEVTLTARWESLAVTFTSAHGPDDTQRVMLWDRAADPGPPTAPPLGDAVAVEFAGWVDATTGAPYQFHRRVSTDLTLRAAWSYRWTVVLDPRNGTAASTRTVTGGDPVEDPGEPGTAPRPVPGSGIDHYAFVGWALDPADGPLFDFTTPVEDNLTLHARWEGSSVPEEHTVVLDGANGRPVTTVEVTDGDPVASAGVFTPTHPFPRGGHYQGWRPPEFEGWYDVDGTRWDLDTTPVADDVVLTARWESVTVTLVSHTTRTIEVVRGDFLDQPPLPEPPPRSITMIGDPVWLATRDLTGEAWDFSAPFTRDVTLYGTRRLEISGGFSSVDLDLGDGGEVFDLLDPEIVVRARVARGSLLPGPTTALTVSTGILRQESVLHIRGCVSLDGSMVPQAFAAASTAVGAIVIPDPACLSKQAASVRIPPRQLEHGGLKPQFGNRLCQLFCYTSMHLEVHSTPRVLGTVPIDEDGRANGAVTLPVDLATGAHELVTILGGGEHEVRMPITVVDSRTSATDTRTGDTLPGVGAPSTGLWGAGGLLALLTGTLLVLTARRAADSS